MTNLKDTLIALGHHQRRHELPNSPTVHVDVQAVECVAKQVDGAALMF
ncbi:hypothetical protein ZWY2020_042531 [Hordeum vulgare]|nr:hypothetical protein ZWY2020_042531 [Hordeum vulgare]